MTYKQIVTSAKKALAKVNVSKADQVAIQVDIVGEGEGAFYVEVKDGTLAIEPYEYYDHDAKLIISGKDCVDLFSGKLDAVKAYEAGKITVEGNLESVLKLKDMIPAKAVAAKKSTAKKTTTKKTTAKKTTTKKTTAKKSTAAKTTAATAEVKAAEKKTTAKPAVKTAEKKAAAKPAAKTAEKKVAAKPAAKTAEKKTAAKPAAKKTTTKKAAAPKKAAASKSKK